MYLSFTHPLQNTWGEHLHNTTCQHDPAVPLCNGTYNWWKLTQNEPMAWRNSLTAYYWLSIIFIQRPQQRAVMSRYQRTLYVILCSTKGNMSTGQVYTVPECFKHTLETTATVEIGSLWCDITEGFLSGVVFYYLIGKMWSCQYVAWTILLFGAILGIDSASLAGKIVL